MNNLRLLNKIFFQFFFLISIVLPSYSEETVDIWKNDTVSEITENETSLQTEQKEESSLFETIKPLKNNIEEENNLEIQKNILAGLFDPQENNLDIDMWSNSDGQAVIRQLKKIDKIKLSEDAEDILFKTLFTNSYPPTKNIDPSIFINYKSEWLINKKKTNLIKLFLEKNSNLIDKSELIKFLVDESLANAAIDSSCENVKFLDKNNESIYLEKFKIYCLINDERIEEAQLQYDLLREGGFKDKFFDNKINFLLGYLNKPNKKISDKNLFEFHLSHRANLEFNYEPNMNTSKLIWKYLSASNLVYDSTLINQEDEAKINLLEKAVAEGFYDYKELFNLYKTFTFNFNQFLNLEDSYKPLPSYKARALIYQALLLSEDLNRKFKLILLLNNLFKKDNIQNAFTKEVEFILKEIDKDDVPIQYVEFYQNNLEKEEEEEELKKIKFNNNTIHKSKLLKYFLEEEYDKDSLYKDLEKIYKKVKKQKKYYFSVKDIILLETLKSDGIEISKKLEKLYSISDLTIPTDLIILTSENETGMVLLKIVEIVGADKLNDLDPETLYFMITTLNTLKLKKIRNNIISKTLPERI